LLFLRIIMAFLGPKMLRVTTSSLRMFSAGPARNAAKTTKTAAPTMKVVSKEEHVKPPKAAPQSSPPVGPGASKEGEYKNPEYYQYNPMSFYDIEKDMEAFRLTQPSSLK